LGRADFTLDQLASVEPLLDWLARCGGSLPAGWLQAISHFFAAYVTDAATCGKKAPLTDEERLAVQKQHPPRLHLDPETGRVSVGWRSSIELQPGQQALLRHLYEHRGQTCRRRELYRAYLEGTGRQLPAQTFEKDYAGPLDNAVYRLRQAIEPDPAHPVLVVTVKGEGFQLDNAW
jgi:DNA-binding response OmpR family regulator